MKQNRSALWYVAWILAVCAFAAAVTACMTAEGWTTEGRFGALSVVCISAALGLAAYNDT